MALLVFLIVNAEFSPAKDALGLAITLHHQSRVRQLMLLANVLLHLIRHWILGKPLPIQGANRTNHRERTISLFNPSSID